jgi:RNA processing factor Prp31
VAVEEWTQKPLNKENAQISTQNISQSLQDTDRLVAAFISHLSEAQKTLLEACNKLEEATHDHPKDSDPKPPFNHL